MEESTAPKSRKKDSKIIVVLELPVGGSVSKYSIGESDDTLEIVIAKHSLMLNPKALLFSGIETGALNEQIDGPLTARGGIRLNECSKALNEYQTLQNKNTNAGGVSHNEMSLKFNLPDYVSRENVIHYSYCFQQSQLFQLQYNITYFEFETKDSNVDIKDDPFMKGSSMFFSDGRNNNNGNGNNEANMNSNDQESSSSSGPASNFNHQQSQQYNSSFSSMSHQFGGKNRNNFHLDNIDEEMEDGDVIKMTKDDIDKIKQQVTNDYTDKVSRYASKLKTSNIEAKYQRKQVDKLRAEKTRAAKQAKEKETLIQSQADEMKRLQMETSAKLKEYEQQRLETQRQLDQAMAAHLQSEQNLSLATNMQKPRTTIHTHADYSSIIDENGSVTPLKRTRNANTAEAEKEEGGGANISSFLNSFFNHSNHDKDQQEADVNVVNESFDSSEKSNHSQKSNGPSIMFDEADKMATTGAVVGSIEH